MDYEESTHVSNPDAPQIAVYVDCRDLKRVPDPLGPIDFEEASDAWMANKLRKGYVFVYRCSAFDPDGRRCRNAPAKDPICNFLCRRHLRAIFK